MPRDSSSSRANSSLALLVVAVLVAGCLGGTGGKPPSTPPAPGTGAVEGRVLDDEGRPVPGAQVRALLRETAALADGEGNYRIDNLTLGAVRLVASAQAHASQTRDLDIQEGAVARVDFVIRRLPDLTPYSDTQSFTGRIECGALQGTNCEAATGASTNQIRFDAEPDLAGIVAEVVWTATAPGTAASLRAEMRAATPDACGIPYASATGGNVLRLEVLDGFPLHGGSQCLRVSLAPDSVGVDQDFAVHVSLFYHAPPPAGFTAAGAE